MSDPVASLIQAYHELNAAVIDELDELPSPLEFMRFVAKNRPFVARGTALTWKAVEDWDAAYLLEVMRDEPVKVALTPRGNADAVVEQQNGTLSFVEPHEQFERFSEFLRYVQEDAELSTSILSERHVKYAQTQNDNLRDEYQNLFSDVPADVPFARIALQKKADAVNVWIGNERSVTALHKDNYENVYVQIRGQKHFTLLSPVELPCVNEQSLPRARYNLISESYEGDHEEFGIAHVELEQLVPVAVWDPDEPEERVTNYSHLAKPLRVTLNEGDMLYLPAMWYHKVCQTAGNDSFACAVNYWYDMELDGQLWASNHFLRDVVSQWNDSG